MQDDHFQRETSLLLIVARMLLPLTDLYPLRDVNALPTSSIASIVLEEIVSIYSIHQHCFPGATDEHVD
jgi:hypothetical protein